MVKGFNTAITAALLTATILVLANCGGGTTTGGGTGNASTAPGGETGDVTGTGPSLGEVVLVIPTIFCTGCWPRVEASARSVPGVTEVKFDKQEIRRVVVTYDPEQATPDAIIAAIERRGDKVTEVTGAAEP